MHGVSGPLTTALDERLHVDRVEQTAWLGLVVTVLLVAACRSVRTLGPDGRRWAWVLGLFAVWSLGPSLSLGGLDTGVLLPQTLARYVPIVANARIPGRAVVMVQLAAVVIVAMLVARREWRCGTGRDGDGGNRLREPDRALSAVSRAGRRCHRSRGSRPAPAR